MFIPISLWKSKKGSKKVSLGAKLLFAGLCFYAGSNGVCYPGIATLAEDMDTSIPTIKRWLKELKEFGLIGSTKRGHSSAQYYFKWHPMLEASLKSGAEVQKLILPEAVKGPPKYQKQTAEVSESIPLDVSKMNEPYKEEKNHLEKSQERESSSPDRSSFPRTARDDDEFPTRAILQYAEADDEAIGTVIDKCREKMPELTGLEIAEAVHGCVPRGYPVQRVGYFFGAAPRFCGSAAHLKRMSLLRGELAILERVKDQHALDVNSRDQEIALSRLPSSLAEELRTRWRRERDDVRSRSLVESRDNAETPACAVAAADVSSSAARSREDDEFPTEAIRKYVEADDEAIGKVIDNCREKAPHLTGLEIAEAIHGSVPPRRKVTDVSFFLDAAPRFLETDAFLRRVGQLNTKISICKRVRELHAHQVGWKDREAALSVMLTTQADELRERWDRELYEERGDNGCVPIQPTWMSGSPAREGAAA